MLHLLSGHYCLILQGMMNWWGDQQLFLRIVSAIVFTKHLSVFHKLCGSVSKGVQHYYDQMLVIDLIQ